jgi:hypothetical protein
MASIVLDEFDIDVRLIPGPMPSGLRLNSPTDTCAGQGRMSCPGDKNCATGSCENTCAGFYTCEGTDKCQTGNSCKCG